MSGGVFYLHFLCHERHVGAIAPRAGMALDKWHWWRRIHGRRPSLQAAIFTRNGVGKIKWPGKEGTVPVPCFHHAHFSCVTNLGF